MSAPAPAVALDLDGALCDTRPLWNAWLAAAEGLLAIRAGELAYDRGLAADQLDGSGAGNWRQLLERFAEERAPVHLRRDAETGRALRALATSRVAIGVYTDAPEPLARVALRHLGADRRVSALETGSGALERLLERLGRDAEVVRTRARLASLASA